VHCDAHFQGSVCTPPLGHDRDCWLPDRLGQQLVEIWQEGHRLRVRLGRRAIAQQAVAPVVNRVTSRLGQQQQRHYSHMGNAARHEHGFKHQLGQPGRIGGEQRREYDGQLHLAELSLDGHAVHCVD
jgi:hypothetical protein